MYKVIPSVFFTQQKRTFLRKYISYKIISKTFLSQAYYCEEKWNQRLKSVLSQKVKLDELYNEIDQKFQKTRQVSAVDVDIFANTVSEDTYVDELLDITHKLRLSADTGNTLNSTPHAIVRYLLKCSKYDELLDVLDDRINYGIFLDHYTANLLLDTFWKQKEFVMGARTSSQLMLQEDFSHPISSNLSLLHCYNYLKHPGKWPEPPKPEEPEDEVKIRVRYLRNPYFDDHFDLRDPNKIMGKTLIMLCKNKNDSISKSFEIIGHALYGKLNVASKLIDECKKNSTLLVKDIFDLLPEENESKALLNELKTEAKDVETVLTAAVEEAVQKTAENDIVEQVKLFSIWEEERSQALEKQKQRLLTAKRLSNVEDLQQVMNEKEQKLWYFENEEQIELEIEAKAEKIKELQNQVTKKKKVRAADEEYIPPELFSKSYNIKQY